VKSLNIRYSVFIPISVILIIAILAGIFVPEQFYQVENKIVEFAFLNFGWLFQISGNLFLVLCLYLMFSKYGKIRLGGPNAKPELSTWNWFSITLTAGIATGILFWGIAEPITHFMNPPEALGLEPGSEAAAMFSMSQTYIHWTFIPYAMYGLAGVGIAYAVYNVKLPFHVSSTLYPLTKNRSNSYGAIVDNIAMFAMVGGVAAVLGVGTLQIASGLNAIAGVESTKGLWISIVAIIVITYIISSYTGLNKGIRWLADKNSKLFILMLLFVFIFGPTQFILSFGTQSFGHFLQNFFVQTHYLSPIDGSQWPRWWPIYYWAIWLAYAPLIGMFLAKISKGRTIREFMMMNLVVPAIFGFMWFTVFGGSTIHLELNGAGIWNSIQKSGMEISVFEFLNHFPLTTVMSIIFILAVYISIVTMADSMTSTFASLSTNLLEHGEPKAKIKIYWGVMMSSIAIINLLSAGGKISGIDATKQIATVAGFPILFFMLIMAATVMTMIIKREVYDVTYKKNNYQSEKAG